MSGAAWFAPDSASGGAAWQLTDDLSGLPTFHSEPLVDNGGGLQAFRLLPWVRLYERATGDRVLTAVSVYTDGTGRFHIPDGVLEDGGLYSADWETAEGERCMPVAGAFAS